MLHHPAMAVLDFKQVLDEQIKQVSLPENLAPFVASISTQLGVDSAGDQAVYITVVLKDALPADQRSFLHLQPLGVLLRNVVYGLQGGQSIMAATPYVQFVTESELSEPEA